MALLERIKRKLTEILTPHFLGREQEALVGLSEAVLDEAQLQTDEGVGGLQAQIDMLRSEYGAGLVGIEDLAGHFSSFNVEGALAELAANTGNFDPDSSYTITAPWTFTQSVSFDAPPLFSEGELVYDGNTIELPAQAGTLALLSDVPAPVNIQAGNGIDVSGVYPNYTITNTIPQLNLIAGSNVNITGTYPNLTISATGGGGGGDVFSVNGQVGDVVLNFSDVGAAAAGHTHSVATHGAAGFMSAGDKAKLDGISPGATSSSGTVTSVNVQGSAGLSFTGGPINTSGTITGTLSPNLQAWNSISPTTKATVGANVNFGDIIASRGDGTGVLYFGGQGTNHLYWDGVNYMFGNHAAWHSGNLPLSYMVNTTSNQTGIAGNKTFTGNITAANLTATSDTRLKYDITRKEPRQELLEFIKLYGWKWIHSKEEGLGVLAQDVQKVAPEYVFEGDDGMLSVDKAGLAIEMVMAMMEKMNGSSD